MPVRLSIPKLAAAGVAPLRIAPRFRTELLQSGMTWPQDVNYLRDTYMDIFALWGKHEVSPENPYNPEDDKTLYVETEPKLRELLIGLEAVCQQVTSRPDIFRMVDNASHDFQMAGSHVRGGDYAMAAIFLSYSLVKLHRVLDGLTLMANKKRGSKHLAYGYDVSGEVMEPGEQESRSPNLWDQGNSPKFDRTENNPANSMVDPEAENDFPELQETKHQRVEWPARSR